MDKLDLFRQACCTNQQYSLLTSSQRRWWNSWTSHTPKRRQPTHNAILKWKCSTKRLKSSYSRSWMTPLTSSSKPYKPTEIQRQVFEKIKTAMITGPLFNNLIDEAAEKYLWVDASTSSNVVGAVLAQKRRGAVWWTVGCTENCLEPNGETWVHGFQPVFDDPGQNHGLLWDRLVQISLSGWLWNEYYLF